MLVSNYVQSVLEMETKTKLKGEEYLTSTQSSVGVWVNIDTYEYRNIQICDIVLILKNTVTILN